MARKAFISYRRDDSRDASRSIYMFLEQKLGADKLFMDVDSIAGGVAFPDFLKIQLKSTRILLAIIGPRWASLSGADGRPRLSDPDDFVRLEIRTALSAGIPVIPVLLDGVNLPPAEELPDDLKEIRDRQIRRVRHETFGTDMSVVLRDVREALKEDAGIVRQRYLRWGKASAVAASLGALAMWPGVIMTPLMETGERIKSEWTSYRQDVASAGLKSEEAAWRTATETKSVEGYEAFLRLYPASSNAATAQANINTIREAENRRQKATEEADRQRDEDRRRMAAAQDQLARESLERKRDADAWTAAEASANRAGYEFYLRQFPGGVKAQSATEALLRIEEKIKADIAAQEARRLDAIRIETERLAAIEVRKKEEQDKLQREAAEKLDNDAWKIAEGGQSPEAYRTYIERFPSGKHIRLANEKIVLLEAERRDQHDLAAWQRAKSLNTLASYRHYMDSASDGRHRIEAENMVKSLEAVGRRWNALRNSRALPGLRALLKDATGTEFQTAVEARVVELIDSENRDWGLIRRESSLATLIKFLERWPEGNHSDEAAARVGELQGLGKTWAGLKQSNDEASLERFVFEHGWSEFGAEAAARLVNLRKRNNQPASDQIRFLTAEEMGSLIDRKDLRLLRSGISVRINSSEMSPARKTLGPKILNTITKENFQFEGAFASSSSEGFQSKNIQGIGGIVISRVDRTGSLFLLEMTGDERKAIDVNAKDRRYSYLNIIRDSFGYVCSMTVWQMLQSTERPELLVERCEATQ